MAKPLEEECPTCFADLRGAHIPDSDPARYYTRLIGIEISTLYDGVLFWECPNCDARYHRFELGSALFRRADPFVRKLDPEHVKYLLTFEMRGELVLEGGETLYNVHAPNFCGLDACALHRPSAHPMKDFPRTWRKRIVYRVCSHQVAHPDPDSLAWLSNTIGGVAALRAEQHLCCGFACCQETLIDA